jgi:hypothetical protein
MVKLLETGIGYTAYELGDDEKRIIDKLSHDRHWDGTDWHVDSAGFFEELCHKVADPVIVTRTRMIINTCVIWMI